MEQSKGTLALSYAKKGWFVFPIRKGTTDKPRVKWGTEATTDEKTIRNWWKAWPDDNIGVACGPSGLCVIDLDMKKGKNGQASLDQLELDHGALPETLRARTPSGGFHLYFKGLARTTVEQVGPGIDTRSAGGAGGYVLAPGSATSVGEYDWIEGSQVPIAALPEWVAHATGRRDTREHSNEAVVEQDQPQYIEWAIGHLKFDAKPAIEGQKGNTTTFYLACVLREKGLSPEKACELMLEHYNPRCIPPWSDEEMAKIVENAFDYASVVPPGGDTPEHDFGDPDKEDDEGEAGPAPIQGEQEERYAGIMDQWVWVAGPKWFVRRRDQLKLDEKSFNSMFNYMVEGGKGQLSQEIFSAKRSMRKFHSFCYEPEEPEFVGEDYNLWRPSDVKPVAGDVSMFLNHMDFLIPDRKEHDLTLDFMAWCVQHPKLKPNFALVVKGFQGTGKSFIGQVMEQIYGVHNTARPSNDQVQSQYNDWAANCRLVVLEELMAKGRFDTMNAMKTMIADPRIPINEKFHSIYYLRNVMIFIGFTNYEDALPLEDDDRRYLIVNSPARPKPDAYYEELFAWLQEKGGASHVLDWLLKRDVSHFNGRGRAPATGSKEDMRRASLGDVESHLLYLWESKLPPFHGTFVAEKDIVDALPQHLTKTSRHLTTVARKFLKNTVRAVNQGQHHTSKGRLFLWSLNQHKANAARPGKIRALVYNRDMSAEEWEKAIEKVEGSEFPDDLPEREPDLPDEPAANVVDMPKAWKAARSKEAQAGWAKTSKDNKRAEKIRKIAALRVEEGYDPLA